MHADYDIVNKMTLPPKVEILIVTFRRDLEFNELLLCSLKKFARGFAGTTLVVPVEDVEAFKPQADKYGARLYPFKQDAKGQLHHQAMKCSADLCCPLDTDLVLHVDSDCFFIAPVTPASYMQNGLPILLREPFEDFRLLHPNRYRWKETTERALGFEVEFETMCRHPAVHHRELYPEFRAHVEWVHQKPFLEYVLAQENIYPQGFAEFPALGAYAHQFHYNEYSWLTMGVDERPKDLLIQYWSHAGVTPETRAACEKVLA